MARPEPVAAAPRAARTVSLPAYASGYSWLSSSRGGSRVLTPPVGSMLTNSGMLSGWLRTWSSLITMRRVRAENGWNRRVWHPSLQAAESLTLSRSADPLGGDSRPADQVPEKLVPVTSAEQPVPLGSMRRKRQLPA